MNIGMVLEGSFPPDIRVEKEAKSLIAKGHEVFLLSIMKNGEMKEEILNGIHISRIPIKKSFLSRLFIFGTFSIFLTRFDWKKYIRIFIERNSIEILHVHDLPLVNTGLTIAKEMSIPIIADLHENYPEAVRAWNAGCQSIVKKIIQVPFSPSRWDRHASIVLPQVSHVIAVIDEGKEYYKKWYGIKDDRISVIMNTEDLEYYDSIKIKDEIIEENASKYIISYIGGFGPHRGIDTAIQAMPHIIDSIPDAKLQLVGGKGSPAFETAMHQLCKDLKIEQHVEFTGWVDFSLVPTYIATSSVCLVPHHASGHTNSTIPHKLFQYMAMKKPIVTTDCLPLKRIVEETDTGFVVPSGDFVAMANAVITLYNNPELARRFGENGRRAVEKKYNWNIESKKLVELYQRFAK